VPQTDNQYQHVTRPAQQQQRQYPQCKMTNVLHASESAPAMTTTGAATTTAATGSRGGDSRWCGPLPIVPGSALDDAVLIGGNGDQVGLESPALRSYDQPAGRTIGLSYIGHVQK